MADFATDSQVTPDEAVAIIQARHSALLNNTLALSELLTPFLEDNDATIKRLPKTLHAYLYTGILSNAGQYRSSHELDGGIVKFGPRQRFVGTAPSEIEPELAIAFATLQARAEEPIRNAAAFYQRFVQIHPFYDANGRIGRAIVQAYLGLFDLLMNWEEMERTTKWLKLLNNCHVRFGGHDYLEYLEYHIKHFSKFIIPKNEIHSDDISQFAP